MKKFLTSVFAIAAVALFCVGAASCSGGDDDDDPADVLTISATDLSLLAGNGSSTSFSVGSNGAWTITCPASWLNLSSKSGNGNATITVTALSGNESSNERSTTITVQCGKETKTITVTQLPLYVSASVTFDTDNMVALTNSIAIPVACSSDVMYYYARIAPQGTFSTKTDDEIVASFVALDDEYRCKPVDDDVWDVGGMSANTTYTLYGVAFDKNGKRGPLVKRDIKTARSVSNRPNVYYSNSVSYTSTEWSWETTIGAYTDRYYMIASSGNTAWTLFNSFWDAGIAYIIKSGVNDGSLTPIRQSSSWTFKRSSSDNYFFSAAWAQDADRNFAPEIDQFYGDLTSSSRTYVQSRFEGKPKAHNFSLSEMKDKINLYVVE